MSLFEALRQYDQPTPVVKVEPVAKHAPDAKVKYSRAGLPYMEHSGTVFPQPIIDRATVANLPLFIKKEIALLRGTDQTSVDAIFALKRKFPGCEIENHTILKVVS